MNISSRSLLGLLLVIGGACMGKIATGQAPQGSGNLEVRDENGKVRCLIGNLGEDGYGLRILGEGKQRLEVGIREDKLVIRGGISEESPMALVAEPEGWSLSLGGAKSRLNVSVTNTGKMRLLHSTDSQGVLVGLNSDANKDGVTALEMRHLDGDKATGVALVADSRGSSLDLMRNGKSSAQMASALDGTTYCLLGSRKLGLYMQATAAGEHVIEFCNRIPMLTLQSTTNGTGIGMDRKDGSTVMRLGTDRSGEVVRKLWSEKGEPLAWDSQK